MVLGREAPFTMICHSDFHFHLWAALVGDGFLSGCNSTCRSCKTFRKAVSCHQVRDITQKYTVCQNWNM